jgi:hypothetical protein
MRKKVRKIEFLVFRAKNGSQKTAHKKQKERSSPFGKLRFLSF